IATAGTASVLEKAGLTVQRVFKLTEGRPNTVDLLKNREIQLVINTPAGQSPRADEVRIRTTAVYTGTPIMTTLGGAKAAALGIAALREHGYEVKTVQEYHGWPFGLGCYESAGLSPRAMSAAVQTSPADLSRSIDILLVEDDPTDAELTLRALANCGLAPRVEHVTDGAEALDYIYSSDVCASKGTRAVPRLILLDLKLRGLG